MALTLTTSAEIIRRAGEGAPTDITGSGALVTSICEDAEGEFIADTRRDWITDYASVNTYIKKKIASAVSSKAAFNIVQNDRSGYFSKSEQETILDVLDNNYNSAVKLLTALDFNEIRSVD